MGSDDVEAALVPVAGAAAHPRVSTSIAFDDWARSSGPSLLRFARLVTGNSADAADAVQDALVAVYPRWRRLSAEHAQDGYARRVIVNRTISWWRRFGRQEHLSDTVEPTASSPDHAAALSDAAAAQALLVALPGHQRAAVMLRFYDDMSFAQIALVLGCRESTARSHVHRALVAMRGRLTSDHSSPDDTSPTEKAAGHE
jgi:RNA polymerase sigma-70 factor (sigma-E family)